MRKAFVASGLLAAAGLVPPSPGWSEERFWLFWESSPAGTAACQDTACAAAARLAGRRLPASDTAALHQLFGALTARAAYEGRPADDPEAPRLCQADLPQPADDGQPLSLKTDALRGISAVGLDLTGLAPPPGAAAGFGQMLQADFARVFTEAGLPVVSPTAAAGLPGQPQLKLFFSVVAPLDGCRYSYSVFATLTQTVRLVRDPSVKLEAGVWSHLGKGDLAGGEADMLREVAVAFLADWRQANAQVLP